MRDKEYNVKSIRVAEEVWQKLKLAQIESGLSWNLFIIKLLENYVSNEGTTTDKG